MDPAKNLKGNLNLILHSARWKGLRLNDIGRVMETLVNPKIYKIPAYWYLDAILSLLDSSSDLAVLLIDRHESETDSVVREFLENLCLEIEKQYPTVARSGRNAQIGGRWKCVKYPNQIIDLNIGDMLPHVNGERYAWEQVPQVGSSADAIIKHEFISYYQAKVVNGRTTYRDPADMAEYSVLRFANQLSYENTPAFLKLIRDMEKDRQHPLTKEIEKDTQCDWTSDDEIWSWYQQLLYRISSSLENRSAGP